MAKLHLVLSTHWDREWYQTFQQFRFKLVDLMDRVLDRLESGKQECPFTLDGQFIPIEDYLEIRPEKKGLIKKLVSQGRLEVGPWFVMPDVWAVSGESIIRNLELGRRLSAEMGSPLSRALNCCDIFGFHSQMPQIIRLAGFETAYVWRGINLTDNRYFNWIGPDGTQLPVYRFGRNGYWAYGVQVRNAVTWNHKMSREGLRENLIKFSKTERDRSETDQILAFDGLDHSYVDEHIYSLFESLKQEGALNDIELSYGTLESFARAFLKDKKKIKASHGGELRQVSVYDNEEHSLIPDPISSRTWIKQLNHHCEILLTRHTEPLSAWARRLGGPDYQPYINLAWKKLITNHPHDSICGTSIDEVHRDMAIRFKECAELAERTSRESMKVIARVINPLKGKQDGAQALILYNPTEFDLKGPHKITLELPYESFSIENRKESEMADFTIIDDKGKEKKYTILHIQKNQNAYAPHPWKSVKFFKAYRVTLYMDGVIPALGVNSLTVLPKSTAFPGSKGRYQYGILSGARSMENRFLALRIEENGSIVMTDKIRNKVFTHLFTLESEPEEGTCFYHKTPEGFSRQTLACENQHLTIRSAGDLACEIEFAFATEEAKVNLTLILEKDSPLLKARMKVENLKNHHRLRVLFPSGCKSRTYFTNSPFDIVGRHAGPRQEFTNSRENDPETKPQESWSAVVDNDYGLGIAAPGIKESALLDREDGALAFTLFRSFSDFHFRNGEKDSLERGEHLFHFTLVPSGGADKDMIPHGLVKELAKQVVLEEGRPVIFHQNRWDQEALDCLKEYDDSTSPQPVKVSGAMLSSLRNQDDTLEIRLYNPLIREAQFAVLFDKSYTFSKGESVDFRGEAYPIIGSYKAGQYNGKIPPKKIITLHFSN